MFGQGNLSVRVETDRDDEIGQLGRSFNEMAERLERLIVSERRLLSDISHELRSPLARLKFAMKLARTSSDSTRRPWNGSSATWTGSHPWLRTSWRSTLWRMIRRLQDTREICVRDIIEEVVRDCGVEAEIRGSRIEVRGEMYAVRCTAILNCCAAPWRTCCATGSGIRRKNRRSNSISARMPTRPSLPFAIMAREFPMKRSTRIFDPFFRVEEARNTNGGGSGLGLSIAKRAVHVHRGTIVAENATPGLRVTITIPLTRVKAIKTA